MLSIFSVSSSVGCPTATFWNLRASAPSFSMVFLYSSGVVVPMHWNSPLDRAGFMMDAASIAPPEPPAPTILWISSMKRMMLLSSRTASRILLSLSSKSPRYFVPATIAPMSSDMILLFSRFAGTFRSTIRMATPSARAVLPTPGSPIIRGLFFFLRHSIPIMRSVSVSRQATGSRHPSSAAAVRSVPNLASVSAGDSISLRGSSKSIPGSSG